MLWLEYTSLRRLRLVYDWKVIWFSLLIAGLASRW
jgi:hypothetical protein